jgi:hypothetical protein
MTKQNQITAIIFLKIDKAIAKLNMKNHDVLEQNASDKKIFVINAYISDASYKTLKRIVRKQMQFADNETLLSKFIQKADICSDDEIEMIDNILLEVEKSISDDNNDTSLEDAIRNITNNKNFDAQLN